MSIPLLLLIAMAPCQAVPESEQEPVSPVPVPQFHPPQMLEASGIPIRFDEGLAAPTLVDINFDGHLDLVDRHSWLLKLKVHLGQGQGKFGSGIWQDEIQGLGKLPLEVRIYRATPQFVDLNSDGALDVLYAHSEFQSSFKGNGWFLVDWGKSIESSESSASTLPEEESDHEKKATDMEKAIRFGSRPAAVDLNDDGILDVVSGNFMGQFRAYKGLGNGQFSKKAKWLIPEFFSEPNNFQTHPFFVDWDEDGDQDLLTGGGKGGAYLSLNIGTSKKPKFSPLIKLLSPCASRDRIEFGVGHITEPQKSTRVSAADLNGDGKLDLVISDQVILYFKGEGLTDDEARTKYAAWREELRNTRITMEKESIDRYQKVNDRGRSIAERVDAGFVWVLYQK